MPLRNVSVCDMESGISELESVPLLPLKDQDSGTVLTSKQKLSSQGLGGNDPQASDPPAAVKTTTKRPLHPEGTELGNDEGIKIVFDESYVENTNVRKLLDAIEQDNGKEIKSRVEAGADPNATYPLTLRQEEYLYKAVWDEDMDSYNKVPTWSRGRPAWSMLQFASAACGVSSVRALLACGASAAPALDVAGAAFHYGRPVRPEHFSQTVDLLIASGARAAARPGRAHSLHTAARLRCARAAAALLRAGATCSADVDGLTPLHRAVELKCEDMVEVLLQHGNNGLVDVSRSGSTPLVDAVAAQWAVGSAMLLRAGADPGALCTHPVRPFAHWSCEEPLKVSTLHLAIELNNTDIVNKILTLSHSKDVDVYNSDGMTPLHTAIEFGHLACVKLLLRHGASLRNISRNQKRNALHVAAFFSYPNGTSILKYLVENVDVSDIINELDNNNESPIFCAVIAGAEPVKILVGKGADVRLKVREKKNVNSLFTPLHFAGLMRDSDTADLILEHDPTTIDALDGMGRTPLVVAEVNHGDGVVSSIIRHGALLSTYPEGTKTLTAAKMIATKLPNPTAFFEKVFDSFMYSFGSVNIDYEAVVEYELFTNKKQKDPLGLVEDLVRCGQRKVLVHPLIETLLYLKWSNLLPIYFFLLGTYAFFVLTLNVFVGMAFYYGDNKEEMPDSVARIFWVDIGLLYGCICLLILQEYIYMRARGSLYWRSLETWLKLGSVALAAALPPWLLVHAVDNMTTDDIPVDNVAGAVVRHAATAALLLAWLEMMFLFARFPHWGYYVLMMGKVASNIAKILLTSVFLILGFALSFMVQFRVASPFDGPLAAFTKTIVMMASEFDYEDLFGKDHDTALINSKTMVRLLFIIFLIFMSIVLMNFIVGVAVNDIHNLTISGNVRRLQKQLEILRTLDTLVRDGVLEKILPGATVSTINKRRRILKITLSNPGTTKIWTVHCENESDNYKIELPFYLYQVLVNTATKIDLADFDKTKDNMVKMLYEAVIYGDKNVDPYSYKQYSGVKVPSKLDDVLLELRKLNYVKEDLRNLQTLHYDDERRGAVARAMDASDLGVRINLELRKADSKKYEVTE